MKRKWASLRVATVGLLVGSGCTTVPAGAEDGATGTTTSASTGGASTGAGGAGGSPEAIPCTGANVAGLRFTNVMPDASAVDFCMGAPGNLSGPVAKLAGAPEGLKYNSFITYDYSVDGPIDIKAVPAGSSCSGPGLAEVMNVCLTGSHGPPAASIYLMGGNGLPLTLAALPNESKDFGKLRLRFLHAAATSSKLDFGLAESGELPTTIATGISSGVAFNGVPKAGNTIINAPIDAFGYLIVGSLPTALDAHAWAAALSGTIDAVVVAPFTSVEANQGAVLTVAAVGKPNEAGPFRLQFVVFDELQKAPTPQTQDNVVSNLK